MEFFLLIVLYFITYKILNFANIVSRRKIRKQVRKAQKEWKKRR